MVAAFEPSPSGHPTLHMEYMKMERKASVCVVYACVLIIDDTTE